MWCYYISFDRVCAPLQYTFPSVLDNCKMTFHTNKGHVFYKKQCADSNLYQTKQTGKSCFVPPGRKQSHNHDKVSRDILEYEIIFWGCLLRNLNGRGEETVNQSVKFVVSTWPHKLSIPDIINGIIGRLSGASGIISRYNGQSKKKLLSDFGEEKYDEFRTFLLSFRPNYWSDPVLVGTEGNPS